VIWSDVMPNLGLENVANLDMESKRQYLFGRNTLEPVLDHEAGDTVVLFDLYLELKLENTSRKKLFIPLDFLFSCHRHLNEKKDARFTSSKKTISLFCGMHKPRYQRLLASCWLSQPQEFQFRYTQSWDQYEHLDTLNEVLQIGKLKDWTQSWGPALTNLSRNFFGDSLDSLPVAQNSWNMITEFYQDAAVATVLEPVFWEQGCCLTEKYLKAVLGGCIPLVNGYRAYDCIAALGFDVFSDVIDTSSQYETNPVLSTWNLLEKNRVFIQNAIDIVHDKLIQERLRANFELVRNQAFVFKNALSNLNTIEAQEFFVRNRQEILSAFERQGDHIKQFYNLVI